MMPLPSIKRNDENLTRMEHLLCARPCANCRTWMISFIPLCRHLREVLSVSPTMEWNAMEMGNLRAGKVNLPIKLQSWDPS